MPTTKRVLTGAATTAVGLAALLLAAVALRARLAVPTAAQRAEADAPSDALESVGGGFPKDKVSEWDCVDWCDANGGVTGYVHYLDDPIHIHTAERRKFGFCATETYAFALAARDAGLVVGVCCCASKNVEPGSIEHAPAHVTCDAWCRAGSRGRGVMIGTAPLCEASCHEDCHGGLPHGGACAASVKPDQFESYEFGDHGNRCATGNKMCCCARHHPEGPPLAPAPSEYITCEQFCRSAGHHGQTFISGTAPSCEGVCRPHAKQCVVATVRQFKDFGDPCLSGDKVCNCY